MGKVVIREISASILLGMLTGLIALIYTFSTGYATNSRVDRIEDEIKLSIRDLTSEVRKTNNLIIKRMNDGNRGN